ncbi:hypothetical protein ACFSHT_33110 [Paraburkholderia silviterrae]|uniref:Uncharacterized protein n=1 Tax=Paraburkholderia silviterrae TaxID=2528715 RepID=A0A4R5M2T4_9BURK|nr:hypothetical protein EYW47_28955 [Paraburkholderia silviterrae]
MRYAHPTQQTALLSRFPLFNLDPKHVDGLVSSALEQIVKGIRAMSEPENEAKRMLAARIDKLGWCFWHGSAVKAASRTREVLTICRLVVPQTPKFADSLTQLGYRDRELVAYVKANGGSTVSYGKRHRDGEPISTAMTESAVNQILNQRMCKRQHMRWSPRGVHLLAQVRRAVINGDLHERIEMIRRRPKAIPIEVAVVLDEFRRAAETLLQGF